MGRKKKNIFSQYIQQVPDECNKEKGRRGGSTMHFPFTKCPHQVAKDKFCRIRCLPDTLENFLTLLYL
jgi:hypothetical protein